MDNYLEETVNKMILHAHFTKDDIEEYLDSHFESPLQAEIEGMKIEKGILIVQFRMI